MIGATEIIVYLSTITIGVVISQFALWHKMGKLETNQKNILKVINKKGEKC